MPKAIMDLAELLERVENDRELVRDLLLIFKEEFPVHLRALRDAVDSKDGQKVASEAHTYMILLTSREAKEDVVAGLESGADDYLTKPFDIEELKARLRTGLRILHLEDRLASRLLMTG